MFISTHKGGSQRQYTYVRLIETYRDVKGKVKIRVVENLGRLDRLQQKDPDILDKLKAKYRCQSEQKRSLQVQSRIDSAEQILQHPTNRDSQSPLPVLQYGHYILKRIWDKQLCLDRKFKDIQLRQTKARFDLNALVSYLTFLKVLDPHSIRYGFGDKDGFLGDPAKELTLDNFYDALDYLHEHKESIMGFTARSINRVLGKEKTRLIFYDVTNAYFETDLTDRERGRQQVDFEQRLSAEMDQAMMNGELDESCFDEYGQFRDCPQVERFFKKIEDQRIQYLRMRGPSKEHRYDLPLVSIALVVNEEAIPIDFAVYAGNASEFKTMAASIESLKKKHHIEQAVVVADRGLNSAANLKMLTDHRLGFLVAQKITDFDEKLTAQMLDEQGYLLMDEQHPEKGQYKVIEGWVKKSSTGTEQVKCTLFITFDPNRQKRDLAILNLHKQIVLNKMKKGIKLSPKNSGWAGIAKTKQKIRSRILGIDEQQFQRKQRLAGYAAVVYRAAEGDSEQMPYRQVAQSYHQLNRIEDCFRIMKSHLGLRPMYVSNSNHIKGHILVCVLALIVFRLLQRSLKLNHISMSPEDVVRTLNEAGSVPIPGLKNILFLQCARPKNFRKDREQMSTEEIHQLIKEGGINKNPLIDLFAAVGLQAPPRVADMHELGRYLGTRFVHQQDAIPLLSSALL